MTTVTFVPRAVAEKICGDYDVVISIMPPNEYANVTGDIIRLNFDDTETPCAGLVMFDVDMALRAMTTETFFCDDGDVLVHCEAGMSRSAAVAKWLADNYGYELVIHPEGVGTDRFYNRHVYRTMDAAAGNDVASYYAALEHEERMMEKF